MRSPTPPSFGPAAGDAPVLLVLAGPAGSGKTTLCERVVRELPGFSRVITTTTRPPRPGEVDGLHYHFLSPAQFDERVAAGAFLEWAWVHQRHRYGTLASSVLEPRAAGRSLVINVDVQGVGNFRRAAAETPLMLSTTLATAVATSVAWRATSRTVAACSSTAAAIDEA